MVKQQPMPPQPLPLVPADFKQPPSVNGLPNVLPLKNLLERLLHLAMNPTLQPPRPQELYRRFRKQIDLPRRARFVRLKVLHARTFFADEYLKLG